MSKALEGFRVVEVGSLVAAPFCTRLLADLGAEVIKVEPPQGEFSRRLGPFPQDIPHQEKSLLFIYLNTNKKGITLNLTTATGQDLFQKLVSKTDLLVEDLPVGTLDGWNIGYRGLSQSNPSLVHLSLTPFGSTGPYRDYKATDLVTTQMGGDGWLTPSGLSLQLFPDREPLKAGGHLGDYYCGSMAAIAALGALMVSRWMGFGQFVDVSKQECQLAMSRRGPSLYANMNILENRITRAFIFGGVMPCKDGYVELIVLDDHQWEGLIQLMRSPDWACQPALKNEAGRKEHARTIQKNLFEWIKDKKKDDLYQSALEYGVPLVPYYSPEEILCSNHLRERDYFVKTYHPLLGEIEFPRPGFRISNSPWTIDRHAPQLGEQNEEVYCGLLGLSKEELVRLRQTGVI